MDKPSAPDIIYILGASYCGSTMLGLVLGSEESVFNAGEINKFPLTASMPPRNRFRSGIHPACTCGAGVEACDIWGRLERREESALARGYAPGFSVDNLRLMLRVAVPYLDVRSGGRRGAEYAHLLRDLFQVVRERYPGTDSIVDGSKSIQTLNWLYSSGGFRIRVIHLVRHPVANIHSFKKRGFRFGYGLLAWLLVNGVGRAYVQKAGLPMLAVSYESLCKDTGREFTRLNEFLRLDLDPDAYVRRMNAAAYHVFSGNPLLRDLNPVPGLAYRGEAPGLSGMERRWATALSPLYRAWTR